MPNPIERLAYVTENGSHFFAFIKCLAESVINKFTVVAEESFGTNCRGIICMKEDKAMFMYYFSSTLLMVLRNDTI